MTLGLEALLTILLPGAMLTGCAALLVSAFAPSIVDASLVQVVMSREWLASIVILLTSALLGSLVSALVILIEERVLDPRAAEAIGSSDVEYEHHWHAYLMSESLMANPFLKRLAHAYYVQMRLGISGYFLTIALAMVTHSKELWLLSLIGCLLFLLLIVAGISSHKGLAVYRKTLCAFELDREAGGTRPDPASTEPVSAAVAAPVASSAQAAFAPWRWVLMALLCWLFLAHAVSPAWCVG